jgi:hypothetical protein
MTTALIKLNEKIVKMTTALIIKMTTALIKLNEKIVKMTTALIIKFIKNDTVISYWLSIKRLQSNEPIRQHGPQTNC